MGMFSDLNPIKQIRGTFESVTGISDARKGIAAANAAQQEAIRKAIKEIQTGQTTSQDFLQAGTGAARDIFGTTYQDALGQLGGGFDQGISYLGEGVQAAQQRLDPLAAMFDPSMANQFSIEGVGQNLASIMDPQGAFGDVISQRMKGAQGMLGAAGLSRSGQALAAGSRIPQEEAMRINQMIFGQQMQNPALAAIQQQAQLDQLYGTGAGQMAAQQGQGMAALTSGYGQNVAGLETALASDLANMQMGTSSNVANLLTGAGASEAQALQAMGGLRTQTVSPFIEAAIAGASQAMGPKPPGTP